MSEPTEKEILAEVESLEMCKDCIPLGTFVLQANDDTGRLEMQGSGTVG